MEEADDFGPGVDLGVSLFAVAILLLAIFGVGSTLGMLRSYAPSPPVDGVEPLAPDDAAARIVALSAQVEDLARRLQAAENRPREPQAAPGEDERATRLVIVESENRELRALARRQRDALSQARESLDPARRPAPLLIADFAEADMGPLFAGAGRAGAGMAPTAELMRRLGERAALVAATAERSPANVLEFAAYSALDRGLDDEGADGGLALASSWLVGLEAALRRRGLAPGCLSFRPVGRAQALVLAGVLSGNDVADDLLAIDRALAQPETRSRLGPILDMLAPFDRRLTVHAVVRDDASCEPGRAGAELRRLSR